jgi:hypothetical protein
LGPISNLLLRALNPMSVEQLVRLVGGGTKIHKNVLAWDTYKVKEK